MIFAAVGRVSSLSTIIAERLERVLSRGAND